VAPVVHLRAEDCRVSRDRSALRPVVDHQFSARISFSAMEIA
jgi:hypothetical protein